MEARASCRDRARESGVAAWAAANRTLGRARDGVRDPACAWPGDRAVAQVHGDRARCRRAWILRDRSSAGPHRRMAALALAARRVRPLLGNSLMPERTVQIVNQNGIHARPAAEIVKLAAKF